MNSGAKTEAMETWGEKAVAGRSWRDSPWAVSTIISISENSTIVNALKDIHAASHDGGT
jgi:hypothetical protein